MLEIGYISLSILIFILILFGYHVGLKKANLDQKGKTKKMLTLVAVVSIWLLYLVIIDKSEILLNLEMPPKFPLLIFLPLSIFMVVFYITNKNSAVIHAIPVRWPIIFQSFRIAVEFLLLFTFYRSVIPVQATFEGLNFDILMGITAPAIAFLIYRQNAVNKIIAYAWNLLGIILILFVGFIIATGIYFPSLWGVSESLVADDFIRLPFLLIPTFLAPAGIFMHVVSLIQLRKIN